MNRTREQQRQKHRQAGRLKYSTQEQVPPYLLDVLIRYFSSSLQFIILGSRKTQTSRHLAAKERALPSSSPRRSSTASATLLQDTETSRHLNSFACSNSLLTCEPSPVNAEGLMTPTEPHHRQKAETRTGQSPRPGCTFTSSAESNTLVHLP